MERDQQQPSRDAHSIDWYAPGECQTVVFGDLEIHVRLVERRGRRGRIAIIAPAGAKFVKHPAGPQTAAQAAPEPEGDAHAIDA